VLAHLALRPEKLEIRMPGTASTNPTKWKPTDFQSGNVPQSGRSYHVSNGMKISGVVSTIEAIGVFTREHGPGSHTVDQRFLDPLRGTGIISRA
jgi:hypothetical protein